MKKIVLAITILLFTVSTFAQQASKENITKLMYAKKGMSGVESISADLAKSISATNKTAFTTKLDNLKTEFIKSTIAQLKSDYTDAEIVAIYNEFTSDKINYEEETIAFFSHYRRLKGLFFRDAKQLFFEYN